jgi:hypothetical protein
MLSAIQFKIVCLSVSYYIETLILGTLILFRSY